MIKESTRKEARMCNEEKTAFSINGVGKTGQRIKLDFSPHMQKINSRQIKGLT